MDSNKLSVSIVIPNYNGRKLLEEHLPAVIAASEGNEIVVVDDASTDDSVEFIHSRYPQVIVVTLEENLRFAGAVNRGVQQAEGDIVVLLNNDVSPADDFLSPLLAGFNDPQVFAVGCKEFIRRDGKMMEQGRGCGAFQRGVVRHWHCDDQQSQYTLWVFGGSAAYRKSFWNKLGGMDLLFHPAYEEDRDISYRALKRGYKILFAPDSKVHHAHETTHDVVLGKDIMQISSFKNSFIFMWKNITHKPYLMQHIFWLPYHMLFTNARTNGLYFKGFIKALGQLKEVQKKRKVEIREEKIHDPEILAKFSNK